MSTLPNDITPKKLHLEIEDMQGIYPQATISEITGEEHPFAKPNYYSREAKRLQYIRMVNELQYKDEEFTEEECKRLLDYAEKLGCVIRRDKNGFVSFFLNNISLSPREIVIYGKAIEELENEGFVKEKSIRGECEENSLKAINHFFNEEEMAKTIFDEFYDPNDVDEDIVINNIRKYKNKTEMCCAEFVERHYVYGEDEDPTFRFSNPNLYMYSRDVKEEIENYIIYCEERKEYYKEIFIKKLKTVTERERKFILNLIVENKDKSLFLIWPKNIKRISQEEMLRLEEMNTEERFNFLRDFNANIDMAIFSLLNIASFAIYYHNEIVRSKAKLEEPFYFEDEFAYFQPEAIDKTKDIYNVFRRLIDKKKILMPKDMYKYLKGFNKRLHFIAWKAFNDAKELKRFYCEKENNNDKVIDFGF